MTYAEAMNKVNENATSMLSQTLEKQLTAITSELDEVRTQLEPLQKRATELNKKRIDLQERIDDIKAVIMRSSSVEKRIEYYLNSPRTGGETYRDAANFFHELGVATNTYNPDTNQSVIRVAMNEDHSNLDQVYEAIKLIKPFVKMNENNQLYFDIMDHMLSEYESYCFVYDTDSEVWEVHTYRSMTYNRDPLFASASLRKTLAYICKNHYYNPIEDVTYRG